MKRELKPFVVEVKRGKRRQSFLGQFEDQTVTMNDATRRAELALFSGPTSDKVATKRRSAEPAGRILPSLIEPPVVDVVAEDEDVPRRRGRKPGSKNKPKSPVFVSPAPTPVVVPRQGLDHSAAPVVSWPAAPADPEPLEPSVHRPSVDHSAPAPADAWPEAATPEPRLRKRLRDRSVILARYVHGTAPAPGEGWTRRLRRVRSGGRTQDLD